MSGGHDNKMVVDTTRRGGAAPPPALKSVRPKLFRRASLTSWGKDNIGMTRAAAVNLKELMLTVQQQKVIAYRSRTMRSSLTAPK